MTETANCRTAFSESLQRRHPHSGDVRKQPDQDRLPMLFSAGSCHNDPATPRSLVLRSERPQ